MVLVVVPALPANGQQAPHPELDAEELSFLSLINQYRADNGLSALAVSLTLDLASDRHSYDMAANDWFDHTGTDGSSPSDRCAWGGYPQGCAENIAAGYWTAQDVFEGWRASPGHNANMLHPEYRAIGIALETDGASTYGIYWTTDFGFVVDEVACACTDGETRACSNVCGPGTETCSGCEWGACDGPQPTAEVCNFVDDDCNGIVDDGGVCGGGDADADSDTDVDVDADADSDADADADADSDSDADADSDADSDVDWGPGADGGADSNGAPVGLGARCGVSGSVRPDGAVGLLLFAAALLVSRRRRRRS